MLYRIQLLARGGFGRDAALSFPVSSNVPRRGMEPRRGDPVWGGLPGRYFPSGPNSYSEDDLSPRTQFLLPGRSFPSGPNFYSRDDLSHRDPIFASGTIFPIGTQFLLPGRFFSSGPNFPTQDVIHGPREWRPRKSVDPLFLSRVPRLSPGSSPVGLD
jgi:hypothetical protein